MKTRFFVPALICSLTLPLISCDEAGFNSPYVLSLPRPPGAWISLLGQPHWRIEWVNEGGEKQQKNVYSAENMEIALPQTWATAVSAWPYWPEKGIAPGIFRPAGAIFPYDVSGNRIYLSWRAGPDAVFYWELALADRQDATSSAVPRLPHYFNWPRFRELFKTGAINENICRDPWLADWRSIAERTVKTGFDRRRIEPEPVVEMNIAVPSGVWYCGSPFAAPLTFPENEMPVFPLRKSIEIWVSAKGILRCNQDAWLFSAW
ncbi:MAG: hypothetical protein FWG99_03415 [Treponema sp.]|nr:hypothetical protein [Treponema sp.]